MPYKISLKFIEKIKQFPVISSVTKSTLFKGAFVLASGTAFAQAINILILPLITRLYTPNDLGILSAYYSVLSIIVVISSLKYEIAFTMPKKDEDAINLFSLAFILMLITSTLFSIILIFRKNEIINFFHIEQLAEYIWFLIIGFFGMGLYSNFNYWAIRKRDYKRITYTKINQSISGSFFKIVLGFFSYGPIGLIIGQIISQIAGVRTFATQMWKKDRNLFKYISVDKMKYVAKKYWSFPVFNLPASLLNSLTLQLPVLMLLKLYNSEIVGYFTLANSLLVIPSSLVSTSLGQAFQGEATKLFREKNQKLLTLYKKTIKTLTFISIPLILIPASVCPYIVPIIFGQQWAEAGLYCLPLALMVISQFISNPTSNLSVYGYNKWSLLWDTTRVLLVYSGFYLSQYLNLSILNTLFIYSIIMFIMYAIKIVLNIIAINQIINKFES